MSRITYQKVRASPDYMRVIPYEIEVIDEYGAEYVGRLDTLEVNEIEDDDETSYIELRYNSKGSRRRLVITEDGSVSHFRLGHDAMRLHDVESVRLTSKRNDERQQ